MRSVGMGRFKPATTADGNYPMTILFRPGAASGEAVFGEARVLNRDRTASGLDHLRLFKMVTGFLLTGKFLAVDQGLARTVIGVL